VESRLGVLGILILPAANHLGFSFVGVFVALCLVHFQQRLPCKQVLKSGLVSPARGYASLHESIRTPRSKGLTLFSAFAHLNICQMDNRRSL
jgi:hypothetical protein